MTASDQVRNAGDGSVWEVFVQDKPGDPHKHAGNVHAHDVEMALQNARDVYARRGTTTSIWVVPFAAIRTTTPSDKASFFDSANDKIYRLPQDYQNPADVRGRP